MQGRNKGEEKDIREESEKSGGEKEGQHGKQLKGTGAKKTKQIVLVLACLGLLVILFLGYSGVFANKMEQHFSAKEYHFVLTAADKAPWLKKMKQKEYLYAKGQVAFQKGDFEDAQQIFSEIRGFEDSDEVYKSVVYSRAEELVAEENLVLALEFFESVENYRDSTQWAETIKEYIRAEELPREKLLEKYTIYTSLKQHLPLAAKHAMALEEQFYDIAVGEYEAGNFETALPYFLLIEEFEDSRLYIQSCELWEVGTIGGNAAKTSLPELKQLSEKINVGPVVLSNEFLLVFLEGDWTAEEGEGFSLQGKLFEFKDIPLGEGYFEIVNEGVFQDNTEYIAIKYIDFNTIELIDKNTGQCYKNVRN